MDNSGVGGGRVGLSFADGSSRFREYRVRLRLVEDTERLLPVQWVTPSQFRSGAAPRF